jgi:ferredoxin/flavodoxin---NADP+ reductase
VDALIIGAGPAGLYAAYGAGFRGLSAGIMDSLPGIGGQVSAMYPEKLVYDVAGFPAVRGRDLVAALAEQAGQYQPRYLLGQQARDLEHAGDRLIVISASGLRVAAKFVVITGGIGTFTPRRLPVLREFEDRGVAYFVPRPGEYRDKDVAILGGGASAFDSRCPAARTRSAVPAAAAASARPTRTRRSCRPGREPADITPRRPARRRPPAAGPAPARSSTA